MKTKQPPANQLDLFADAPTDYSQLVTDSAYHLLDILNEGRKKQLFRIEYSIQQGEFVILIAVNVAKQVVCNVINKLGEIPKGLTPNWRLFQIVEEDLKKEFNVIIRF